MGRQRALGRCAVLVLMAALGTERGLANTIEFPPGQTEVKVPLIRARNHLLARVRINGQDAGLFLIDTGASSIMIDRAKAIELKLPLSGKAHMSAIGGDAELCTIDELELSGVKARPAFAFTIDLTKPRQDGGIRGLNGVIGGRFLLSQVPFDINWVEASLTFYNHSATIPSNAIKTDIRLDTDVPTAPLRFESGNSGWFIVDTGADGGVNFGEAFSEMNRRWLGAFPWVPVRQIRADGDHFVRMAQLTSLNLAGLTLPSCPLEYSFDSKLQLPTLVAGSVGLDVLRHLELTFDYKAGALWVRRLTGDIVPAEWGDPKLDPNSTDAAGVAPLMMATELNRPDYVKRFLAAGARVDTQDGQGHTALHSAAFHNSPEIAQMLIEAGSPINAVTRDQASALQMAAGHGAVELVRMLLEHGAKADVSDVFGETPLIVAAQSGNSQVMTMLIKAGSDLNAVGGPSGSALNAAAYYGRTEAAKLLLDAGADIKRTDRGAKTPLLGQAAYGGSAELVRLLLDRPGIEIDARNADRQTPLFAAALGGHPDIVKILLEHGADPTLVDRERRTALERAAMDGQYECVETLYEYSKRAGSPSTTAPTMKQN